MRWEAAEALAKVGPQARAAVPALCKVIREGDDELQKDAATTLGRIGPDAKAAVDDLATTLRDKDDRVRIAAALALWRISRHEAAIPTLVRMLQSDRILSRDEALEHGGDRLRR